MKNNKLILASASPRRAKILKMMGLDFDVIIADVEEIMIPDNSRKTAEINAELKLKWSRKRYPEYRIITADTVVDLNGQCITKPESIDDAFKMIKQLSGRSHTVFTGVGLYNPDGKTEIKICTTEIKFKNLQHNDIEEYFKLVNPLDKAGAYDADQYGELLIESYKGSRTNIMGLPQEIIAEWLSSKA